MDSETKLRMLEEFADALPFGLYLVAPDNTVQYGNRAAQLITGYLARELVGRSWRTILVNTETPARVNSEPTTECSVQQNHPGEIDESYCVQHKDGFSVPVSGRSLRLNDQDGAQLGSAQVFQRQSIWAGGGFQLPGRKYSIDSVLTCHSESATRSHLQLALSSNPPECAAFILEIEQLDLFTKTHGTEMVRAAKKALSQTVLHSLSTPHLFGCYDSQGFLVLLPCRTEQEFAWLDEHVRTIVHSFGITWWGDRIGLQVVTRGTALRQGESPDSVLARLAVKPHREGKFFGAQSQCS